MTDTTPSYHRGGPRLLTEDQVRQIRREHPKRTMRDLAAEMGIRAPSVFKVIHRISYKDVI